MHVVIEGPDATGKSTLVSYLTKETNLRVQASEGPEKYYGEMVERVKGYFDFPRMIFDRHPCVSQPIYAPFRNGERLPAEVIAKFYSMEPLFIYCRPNGSERSHVVKGHDTAHHLAMMEKYHDEIDEQYDRWALRHATIIYRIGDDITLLCKMVRAWL
jgi:hypothetical protein